MSVQNGHLHHHSDTTVPGTEGTRTRVCSVHIVCEALRSSVGDTNLSGDFRQKRVQPRTGSHGLSSCKGVWKTKYSPSHLHAIAAQKHRSALTTKSISRDSYTSSYYPSVHRDLHIPRGVHYTLTYHCETQNILNLQNMLFGPQVMS